VSRNFDLYPILSLTHRLPCEGPPVQEVLEYMTGARFAGPGQALALGAFEPCREALFEQHPQLHSVPPIPSFQSDEEMDAWCDEQRAALGTSTLSVDPLPPGRWEYGNVAEGISDMRGTAKDVWIGNPTKPTFGLDR
jgi:hypothetical protein